MPHVAHFDIHQNFTKFLLTVDDLKIAQHAFMLIDRIGQIGQRIRPVGRDHRKAAGIKPQFRIRLAIPIDVNETFRGGRETFQHLAIRLVDGDAFSGGDNADNPIAGQRMAAAGVAHIHPADQPSDRKPAVFPRAAGTSSRSSRASRAHRQIGQHPRRARGLAQLRIRRIDHVLGPNRTIADRDIEIVDPGEFELFQGGIERFLAAVNTLLPERLGERRAALIDVDAALFQRKVAPDARPRLAGNNEPLP